MPAADGLGSPDPGDRLAALRRLAAGFLGRPLPASDLALRSDHGLGIGESPCAAAWRAAQAGAGIAALCDDLTTAGCGEFAAGCAMLGIQAVAALEIGAADPSLADAHVQINDAAQPGRIRLIGLGLGQIGEAGAQATLTRLRQVRTDRSRAAIARLDAHLHATVGAAGPAWGDVLDLTRSGNVAQVHVAQAVADRIRAIAVERSMPAGEVQRAVLGRDPSAARLFARGGPCHIPDEQDGCPSPSVAVGVITALGGIPAYPLDDAGSRADGDLSTWCDRLAAWGVRALVVPDSGSAARAAAAEAEAGRRGWLVVSAGPCVRPAQIQGARCVLGHQRLRAAGQPGYLGLPTPEGCARCIAAAASG